MEIETIKRNLGVNWKSVKLGEVFSQIKNGASIKQTDGLTGIPITRIETISNSNLDYSKLGYANINDESYKDFYLENGDILMSHINSWTHLGKNAIVENLEKKIIHGMNLLLLKANKELIHPKYSKHYFDSDLFRNQIDKIANQSVNQSSFSVTKLRELIIPLPPLATQKRIAEILDAADALRRKDQELLKKYDELAQGIFIDMFGDPVKNEKGWKVSALEDLCIDIVDCPHTTPNHTEEITDFPCIRTSEMKNRKISWGSMKYLNIEEYSKRVKRLIPEAGDIVYAREGTYGQAVLLPENYHFALGQRTMLLRPNSDLVSNEFLWYQINSDFVYRQAKRKNMGSTVGHVNVADVKKFNILVPPVQLQLKFTNAITNLNSAESLFENQESDKLFDSLIQKAFKGELVN